MKYKVWFRNWADESISFTIDKANYEVNARGKCFEFIEGGTYEITARASNDSSSYVSVKKEFIIDDYCVIDCSINAELHELELKNPLVS